MAEIIVYFLMHNYIEIAKRVNTPLKIFLELPAVTVIAVTDGALPRPLASNYSGKMQPNLKFAPCPTRPPLEILVTQIVEHHHAYLRAALPQLSQGLLRLHCRSGKQDRSALDPLAMAFSRFLFTLDLHIQKEAKVFFPYLKEMEFRLDAGEALPYPPGGNLQKLLTHMLEENIRLRNFLNATQTLLQQYTVPPCAAEPYQRLQKQLEELRKQIDAHFELEHAGLFPRAFALAQAA